MFLDRQMPSIANAMLVKVIPGAVEWYAELAQDITCGPCCDGGSGAFQDFSIPAWCCRCPGCQQGDEDTTVFVSVFSSDRMQYTLGMLIETRCSAFWHKIRHTIPWAQEHFQLDFSFEVFENQQKSPALFWDGCECCLGSVKVLDSIINRDRSECILLAVIWAALDMKSDEEDFGRVANPGEGNGVENDEEDGGSTRASDAEDFSVVPDTEGGNAVSDTDTAEGYDLEELMAALYVE